MANSESKDCRRYFVSPFDSGNVHIVNFCGTLPLVMIKLVSYATASVKAVFLIALFLVIISASTLVGGCGNGGATSPASTPSASPSAVASSAPAPTPSVEEIPSYNMSVVSSFPHDRNAFTQGLVVEGNNFIESTGLNGRSSLRRVEIRTGKVLKKVDISNEFFAEGLTTFQGKIYQLTWKNQKGFIYDQKSFDKIGTFAYEGEGWGLTHDDKNLILSDGTNKIRFLDPATFKVARTIEVMNQGLPETNLNELEYVRGEIYANIWQTDFIARIDPKTGKMLGLIDCNGLLPPQEREAGTDVLNGIAYDAVANRLFVTGKNWPHVYEIALKKL